MILSILKLERYYVLGPGRFCLKTVLKGLETLRNEIKRLDMVKNDHKKVHAKWKESLYDFQSYNRYHSKRKQNTNFLKINLEIEHHISKLKSLKVG